METWSEDFKRWLSERAKLSNKSIENYLRNLLSSAALIDADLSKINTREEFLQFHENLYGNLLFQKQNANGIMGVSVAQFHDYIFSKYPDWPETKWMGNTSKSDEDERCNAAMLGKDAFEEHSWKVISNTEVIKKTDQSFFRYDGSRIPVGFRFFFEVEKLKHGEKKEITLVYGGEEYGAIIHRENIDLGRTRLYWRTTLKRKFNESYSFNENDSDLNPSLKFTKVSENRYNISFVEADNRIELNESEEQNINEKIRQKYIIPNTPQEAEEILKQISEEMLNQTIDGKRKVSYVLSRNPIFARLVKERDGYVCQICGEPGFNKKNGGLYAEAHHLDELAIHRIDNPHRMICICPACHRVIHYGTEEELEKRKLLKPNNDIR